MIKCPEYNRKNVLKVIKVGQTGAIVTHSKTSLSDETHSAHARWDSLCTCKELAGSFHVHRNFQQKQFKVFLDVQFFPLLSKVKGTLN